ncbi:RNA ligase [Gordonia phage Bakery]|uniref:RNA ligase n=1 Tax=Gordonia phage Bakery TaxID=2591205 RepID=A0A514DGS4_9CAUD|nr:RNA ligase [Gordonia phage Bakery]QDH92803.1 RNA ligase [Gordonia phage Bakery]
MTAAGNGGDDHDTDGMVALLPTAEDAARLAIGNVTTDELHLTLAYLPDVGDYNDPHAIAALFIDDDTGSLTGDVNGEAILGAGSAAVWIANVLGLTARRNALVDQLDAAPGMPDVSHDFDGFTAHLTYETKSGHSPADAASRSDGLTLAGRPDLFGPVTFDRLRVSLRGKHTDVPLGSTDGIGGRETKTPESRSAVA